MAIGDEDGKPFATVDLGFLPRLLGYSLRRAQVSVFADFYRALEDLDLTPAQYTVLHLIKRNEAIRSSQIAEALGIKRTNFVVLLETLERAGLVERRSELKDRRAAGLHLLKEGEELLSRADKQVRAHERRIAKRLGPADAERLLQILAQLSDARR